MLTDCVPLHESGAWTLLLMMLIVIIHVLVVVLACFFFHEVEREERDRDADARGVAIRSLCHPLLCEFNCLRRRPVWHK